MRYEPNTIIFRRSCHSPSIALWAIAGIVFCCGCGESGQQPDDSGQETGNETSRETTGLEFEFDLPDDSDPSDGDLIQDLSFPTFHDISRERGVDHTYRNGTSSRQLMTESTGAGAGWLDFDCDGQIDLCLPQGGEPTPDRIQQRGADRLFRQRPDGVFQEVADLAGTVCFEYGQGVTSADFNEDGFPDLLVTNVGPNLMLSNNGDGTFSSLGDDSLPPATSWSTSAAFGDVDQDGDLDLYICNYADYAPHQPIECLDDAGKPSICHPRNVPAALDQFYLNNSDGTFTECALERGLHGPDNRALCLVMLDLNRDGSLDIYVGNDTTANFLFLNDGSGFFTESALGMGGAVNATGASQASMGIAVGDFDRNGFQDLCLTHFSGEYNTLYQNNGPGGFRDFTSLSGLRSLTLPKLAFGAVMHDFNGDGHEDLLFANGHIDPVNPDGDGYEMKPQVLSFNGQRWVDGSDSAGAVFQEPGVGRGIAIADIDGDGDSDAAYVRQNSPVMLLENTSDPGNTIRLGLIGTECNRNALGSYVAIDWGNGMLHEQALFCGESYASANQHVVEFARPAQTAVGAGTVKWPDGSEQTFQVTAALAELELIQGHSDLFEAANRDGDDR